MEKCRGRSANHLYGPAVKVEVQEVAECQVDYPDVGGSEVRAPDLVSHLPETARRGMRR